MRTKIKDGKYVQSLCRLHILRILFLGCKNTSVQASRYKEYSSCTVFWNCFNWMCCVHRPSFDLVELFSVNHLLLWLFPSYGWSLSPLYVNATYQSTCINSLEERFIIYAKHLFLKSEWDNSYVRWLDVFSGLKMMTRCWT